MTAKLLATAFIILSISVGVVKPRTSPTEEKTIARSKAPYAKDAHLFDQDEFEYLATRPDLMEVEIAARKDSPAATKQPKKTTKSLLISTYPNTYDSKNLGESPPEVQIEIDEKKQSSEDKIAARARAGYAKYAHLFDKYEFEYLATRPDMMEEEIAARKEPEPPKENPFGHLIRIYGTNGKDMTYLERLTPPELLEEIARRKLMNDLIYEPDFPTLHQTPQPGAQVQRGDGKKKKDKKRKEVEREKNKYNPYYQVFGDKFKWPGTRR